jgi:hypothetical protein
MKTEVGRNWYQSIHIDELTVLPARVLFRAPMDTITRRAKTFPVSLAHFDTAPTCWVSNISQQPYMYLLFIWWYEVVLKGDYP